MELSETLAIIEEKLEKIVEKIVKKVKDEIAKELFSDIYEVLRDIVGVLKEVSQKIGELTEAQKRTEERLNELAEAQKRTEEAVSNLVSSVKELAKQVGKLSDLIGFSLEDIARVMVPSYLEKHYGVIVDKLEPKVLIVEGEELWLNLYGSGRKNGKDVMVVGECKSQMRRGDVRDFAARVKKIRKFLGREVVAFMFGFLIHPSADEEAKKENIIVLAPYRIR